MKKLRPFWSYRIEETEKWLEDMAQQGYELKTWQPDFSVFTFEQGDSTKKRFLIEYDVDGTMYEQGGWQLVHKVRDWAIYSGQQPTRFSSRQKIFERFQSHYRIGTILFAILFTFLNTSLGFFMGMHLKPVAAIVVFIALLLSFVGLSALFQKKYDKREQLYLHVERQQAKDSIRKRRIGWMYAQYLTKRWLERMLLQGYELDYVKGISFYFKPRVSEKVSYEILNKKPSKIDSLLFYKETGWETKCLYSTPMWHISIWAKAYTESERKPRISYVKKERLASVKRGMAISNMLAALFVLLMWMNMSHAFRQLASDTNYALNMTLIIVCSILSMFWLWVIVQNMYGYWQERQLAQRVEMEQD